MSWTSATARRTWVVRRFVLAPAVVALTALVWALLPVGIVVSALVSPLMSGRWRALRLFWLLVVWLSIETVCLAVLLGWWVASGFGRRIRTPYWEGVHYDLAQGMTWVLFGRAERVLNLRVVTEGPDPDAHPGHPLVVVSRHAGPGDSLVLVHALLHWYRREPRIVLKDTIAWDPLAGVLLGRIPSRFVTPGGDAGDTLEGQVAALATGLDDDDAFVIFPEGGNFTPGRRQRGIDRLRERGLEPMARRAEALTNVLAPRPGRPPGRPGRRPGGRRRAGRPHRARPPADRGRPLARGADGQAADHAVVAGAPRGGPARPGRPDRVALRLVGPHRRLGRRAPSRAAGPGRRPRRAEAARPDAPTA